MIISCPECATKFSIADAVLGERGRKVRCFKCGHAWHQMPEAAAPNMPPPLAVEPMETPAETPPVRRPAQQPLMPPTPTVDTSRVPLESDPIGGVDRIPTPRRDAGPFPMDSETDDAVADTAKDFDIPNIVPPDDLSALSATRSIDDGPSGNTVDVDALLDARAEDIPKVFANRIQAEEKKSVWGLLVFLILLLGGIGAGLWFARLQIVQRFPGAAPLYKAIGVPMEILGDSLEFRGVTSEMVKEGKLSVLLVRGVIANVASTDRPVPLLRLVLLDTGDGVIQESYAKPRKDALSGGAQIGFQIRMEDPSAAAVRYEVTFAEAPVQKPVAPASPQAAVSPLATPVAPPPGGTTQ
ncbi:MAG: zinc-ribbon domain-containing protein [Rhodospirillaceae bacterium]|nr:zinc-ribbon domain-containing protein [Rhodospirillaceae bacterium]